MNQVSEPPDGHIEPPKLLLTSRLILLQFWPLHLLHAFVFLVLLGCLVTGIWTGDYSLASGLYLGMLVNFVAWFPTAKFLSIVYLQGDRLIVKTLLKTHHLSPKEVTSIHIILGRAIIWVKGILPFVTLLSMRDILGFRAKPRFVQLLKLGYRVRRWA